MVESISSVPENRWTETSGEPRYRKIDDPEETFNRRSGAEVKIVGRSETEEEKPAKAKLRRKRKP